MVDALFNVVIQGVEPVGGCPPPGAEVATLTSTVARMLPPFSLRSGSNGEVIKVRNSSRITVKFLNIRDGLSDDGLDYKATTGGNIFCNCITNNEEGVDLDGGSCNQVVLNLVTQNENGVRASSGAARNLYRSNTVSYNSRPVLEASSDPAGRHNGLILSQSATQNHFELNHSVGSPDDGLKLVGASGNCVIGNLIDHDGGDPLAAVPPDTGACELSTANNNMVDCNTMTGSTTQGGQPSNVCRVVSGSGNTGSNLPGGAACAATPCPPFSPACTIAPIP
jgi:hypothetical protein